MIRTNRLDATIRQARRSKKKLFCAFLTLGFPNLAATGKLIHEFEKAGVDILELGFPFSDPLADGPTIQYSSEQSLARGTQIKDAFELVARLRRMRVKIPILFFSYLNPVYHFGLKRFVRESRRSGFDGIIIPDLPPEEEPVLQKECRAQGLAQVFLVAPTTDPARARLIQKHSQGFLYYVSLRGVTGARKALPQDIRRTLRSFALGSAKPVLIGFGVSSPEQAKLLARLSDGVIVGSAIIDRLRRSEGKVDSVARFVRNMVRAVKS